MKAHLLIDYAFNKANCRNIIAALLVIFSCSSIDAATIESAQSGDWMLTSTWVGGVLPGAADDVVINTGHTVTLSANRPCKAMTIETSATLTLSGLLTNSGPVINQGTLTLSGHLNNYGSFLNQGTVDWTGIFGGIGSVTNDGILNVNHGRTDSDITNNANKTINWNGGWLDYNAGGQTLTNFGTLNISDNASACQMAILNKSGGSVVFSTGTGNYNIVRPFTNENGGTVTVNTGASLTFQSGGNLINDGDFSGSGGTVNLVGGSHTFNPGNTFGGLGTLNFSGNVTVTASDGFAPAFATVNHINGTLSPSVATSLTIPNGTTWNWTSGEFGAFTGIINDGVLNVNNSNQHNTSADITNNADKTINWNGGWLDYYAGGQTLTNFGTFNLIGNNSTGFFCSISIVNKNGGEIVKGGTTSANLNIIEPFTNESGGTVMVNTGSASLTFQGGNLTNDGDFSVSGGTVNLVGGSHTFNPGNTFGGLGTLNFNGDVTVTAPGGFAPAFTIVNLSGATLLAGTATSLIIPNGTIWNWGSGTFGAFTGITNNGTLDLIGPHSHNTSANITNNVTGTINWNQGYFNQNASGETLSNFGTFNIANNAESCGMFIVNKNGGDIVKSGTYPYFGFGFPFINESGGTVTVNAGSSVEFGSLTNEGTFAVSGTVTLGGSSHTFNPGNTFGGSGTLNIYCNGMVFGGGFAPTFSTVNYSGFLTQDLEFGPATSLIIPEGTTWNWAGGSIGAFTGIINDGTLNFLYGDNFIDVNITNNAGKTINWYEGYIDYMDGIERTLTNYGLFNLIGDNPDARTWGMKIVNKSGGSIIKGGTSDANLDIIYDFTNESGGTVTVHAGASLTFQAGVVFSNFGTLQGEGTYDLTNASISNFGDVAPGTSPGILSITGNYANNGDDLVIELGGTTAGTEYDRLNVSGTATLSGGDIQLSLINGYVPQVGHSFTILDAVSLSGSFSSPADPFVFGGYNWSIIYIPTEGTVVLNVLSLLPVELLDFQAKSNENAALLTWRTASETNNHGFHIEKSTDGRQFGSIGFVEGSGSSHEERSYSFKDENFHADAYYRLRQIDFDGQEELSKLIFLKKEKGTAFHLYPNPAAGWLTIAGLPEDETATLTITDASGQAVLIKSAASLTDPDIDVSGLQPGIYFIEIQTAGDRKVFRVVKR